MITNKIKAVFLLPVFLFFACDNSSKDNESVTNSINEKKIVSEENELIAIDEKLEEDITGDAKDDFKILLPTEYRDWENKNPATDLTKNWIDLYQKGGKYYLAKANYRIKRGYSECSGDSTKIINSKNKTILLIDYPSLELGEITSLIIKKNKIWPKEKLTFRFGNDEYTLRAEGKVISSETVSTDNGEELYQKVENYKLYISKNNSPETLFLEQESFNDTFVELLFTGDIDKDGKLDFIFGANRDYEEERVILYLSSKAKKDQLIKKVAEIAVQFDC